MRHGPLRQQVVVPLDLLVGVHQGRLEGGQLRFGLKELDLLERLLERGLRCGELGLGGLERGEERPLVDHEEQLPLPDFRALFEEDLIEGARDLGA